MNESLEDPSARVAADTSAARFHRRTQIAAAIAAGIGVFPGLAVSLFVLANADGDLRNWILGLLAPIGSAAIYAGAAFAASTFVAPVGFFDTDTGRELLATLQVRSVTFARILAAVLIALCVGMIVGASALVADLIR